MHIGPGTADGELVWHLVPPHDAKTLCGARVSGSPGAAANSTDRHCAPCMVRFQQAMEAASAK
ncbi:hypothetical protein [Streptomyces flavalbus]|uniref:Uncharacterized protein n=1 Tax=Streptomyces flavalbus TaxID=2665155 RepID=A0ABW2W077_9ACTN